MKVYIDGKYFGREEARISVFDHGLLYGDGIFEGIRVYRGRIFKLREHIERLFDSAKSILLDIPHTREEMAAITESAVRENGTVDGYVRLIVTRGVGDLGINPYLCGKASVIVIVGEIELYPREHYEKGIPIVTAPSRRLGPDVFDPRVKSLNYLNNVLAKIEARQAGCLEAVLLNSQGFVSECTADNVFLVKKGTLFTPSPVHSILDGITRRTVMELAAGVGVPFAETALTRYDLYTADECFLTGTGAEIMPITTVDGRSIGSGLPGTVTRKLRETFAEYVTSA
jgi:branched-chain amino acid aminotransferase